jgi:hypothetical protein
MVTRTVLLLDRIATLVLALLLLAAGLAGLWWWSGREVSGTSLPGTSSTSAVTDALGSSAVAWGVAVGGVVLALVGLRWILAHLRRTTVSRLRLSGSGPEGRNEALAGKALGAAADAFATTDGVRSARGAVVRDRGQLVARVDATIEPEADLALVAARADEVTAQLNDVLGRDDLRAAVRLRVALRGRSLSRVH